MRAFPFHDGEGETGRNSSTRQADVLYNAKRARMEAPNINMTPKREYPEYPLVGVGGVVVHQGRALLIRRGGPPLQGEWSIPGGMLEVGETLAQGVTRELAEETGLDVQVVELIEVFERIFPAPPNPDGSPVNATRPQYHFVIIDYLCEMRGGTLAAGSDAMEFAWTREEELVKFNLTVAVTRVLRRAFALAKERTAISDDHS
jgi:8-oxo-dGTP diphosphatase